MGTKKTKSLNTALVKSVPTTKDYVSDLTGLVNAVATSKTTPKAVFAQVVWQDDSVTSYKKHSTAFNNIWGVGLFNTLANDYTRLVNSSEASKQQ